MCRAHWMFWLLSHEIGVGERGKGAECSGDGPRRNAEKQGGAISHPGFWVPRTVPTVTPNPLLSCLPDFLPVLLPNTGFSPPRSAHPFRRWSFPNAQGDRAKSLGITPFSPVRPLPRPPSRKCPPPHSQPQPSPLPFISSGHVGARRPSDLPAVFRSP